MSLFKFNQIKFNQIKLKNIKKRKKDLARHETEIYQNTKESWSADIWLKIVISIRRAI